MNAFAPCAWCHELFESWQCHDRKYCSQRCAQLARRSINPSPHNTRKLAQRHIPAIRCQRCGTTEQRLERHHFDYARPLDVIVLCSTCHNREHAANKTGPYSVEAQRRRTAWMRKK